ncbi:membrane protein, partial [Fulvivirga sp. RKSG066]|uniref:7TM-DISM domain-containing protein n=1 Tax=Fulvivirga aurantia TaxID=2529383 RepID=UPI0016297239
MIIIQNSIFLKIELALCFIFLSSALFGQEKLDLKSFEIDSLTYFEKLDEVIVLQADEVLTFTKSDSLEIASYGLDVFKDQYNDQLVQQYYDEASVWQIFKIKNSLSITANFVIIPSGDNVSLWISKGHTIEEYRSGIAVPPNDLAAIQATPSVYDPAIVPVEIPAGEDIIVKLKVGPPFLSSYNISTPSIASQRYYFDKITDINNEFAFQALFQGMLLLLFIYNLIIFIGKRDTAYLHYSLFVASISFYFLVMVGLDRLWLGGLARPFSSLHLNLVCYAISIFYPLFTVSFLHKTGWKPRLRRLFIIYIYLSIVFGIVTSILLLVVPSWQVFGAQYINIAYMPIGLLG